MTDYNKNEDHQNQNHIKLTEEMTNSQISVDFMLCNINSLLHQAKKYNLNSIVFGNILESLYDSFLIHKQQLSNLFIKLQKKYIQKSVSNQAIIALREDFLSKLQSLEILVFQQDKQELIKRIGQYKKVSNQNKHKHKDQNLNQSSFFESSISQSQEQNQYQCQEVGLHDQSQQTNRNNRLKTNLMDQAFCVQSQSQLYQKEQFNLVFENIEIKQVHSIQCFMSEQVEKAIQQIEDENTQFQKKQQIWLQYLQKCSQQQLNQQQQYRHVKEEQIIHAIETFRTQMSLKQQSNRQSGIQQLIQTRFFETENVNQSQLENKKFNSPFKHQFHFAGTETNQQSQIYRTKSKAKSSTIKSKNKNLSQVILKNKQSNNKKKQKSIKKVSKNKQNNEIQSIVHINTASNKKNISKNDKLDQLSAKIQKKLCLNKQQRQNLHLQTDKKICVLPQKLKKDKSSQKKTVKKTLVSFCF